MTTKVCSFCGNKNVRETCTHYLYRHDGRMLIVEDVPCEECEYCGEQYFRADVLRKIEQDFLDVCARRRKPQSEVMVQVESFA